VWHNSSQEVNDTSIWIADLCGEGKNAGKRQRLNFIIALDAVF
jgi:hypothetical protein